MGTWSTPHFGVSHLQDVPKARHAQGTVAEGDDLVEGYVLHLNSNTPFERVYEITLRKSETPDAVAQAKAFVEAHVA